MPELTWGELAPAYFRMCESRSYAEALDLVERGADLFPNRHLYYNWLLCSATGVSTERGIQALSDAIAGGYWFDEMALREDPDLQPLQGLPEFERLIVVCQERRATAQAQAVPELLTLLPDERHRPYPLLLALHGNANSIASSVDHWRSAVGQGWLLALPQSSQVFEPGQYVWDDHDRAVREVVQHTAALRAGYPVDPARTVIGGFSIGGGLALWLAATGALPACGVVLVAPYLPDVERLGPLLSALEGPAPRAYIVFGEHDHEYATICSIVALLRTHDVPLEVERHPDLDHRFPLDFQQSLARALPFIGH